MELFATCARGLESALAMELRQLAAEGVEAGRGGVKFSGSLATVYRANLWLRTAVRVLRTVLQSPVESTDELYAAVQTIDWSEYMTPEQTLAVDCNVRDSKITHSQYAARRVKDAICDQFLTRCGRRPSVDPETPMIGLNLHVYRDHATLSLDSSGESLHKRGYRPILTKAPLNEALAAGLLLLSGWDATTPFVDPMCGSGTLPIEAAWIALRRPPGLTRPRFGFQGWLDFDIRQWTDIRDEARRTTLRNLPVSIQGSDVRSDAVQHSIANARAAGIGHLLTFSRCDFAEAFAPSGPAGTLICNPPYGERIGDEKELVSLYRNLGSVFRQRWAGWRVWVFTGNGMLARQIRLPVLDRIHLTNGKIPCQFLRFDVSSA
jgi:putative N6-adenine-specific DNA methylase